MQARTVVGRVLPADSKTLCLANILLPQATPRIARHNTLGDLSAGKSRVANMFLRCPSIEGWTATCHFQLCCTRPCCCAAHWRPASLCGPCQGQCGLFSKRMSCPELFCFAHVRFRLKRSQKGYSAPAMLQTERHVRPFPRALPSLPVVERWTPEALMRLLPSSADDAIAQAASVGVAASSRLR